MFKKIYLEITNNCNLKCDFCIKNNRDKKFMSIKDFQIILLKLKKYTKYLYFHVSGEPLLHPQINELINLAHQDFLINITTNGYLIKRIINNSNIRQINISLHSFSEKYHISLEEYLNNIWEVIIKLKKNTYFSLRFWVDNKYNQEIVTYFENKFQKKIELIDGFKLTENVFIGINEEFIWPSLDNSYFNTRGCCYALKDHVGILVNGDVVPCCLDANGVIVLGNIFKQDLDTIINLPRYQKMKKGFQNKIKLEKLCQHCNFLDKKNC